MDIRDAGMQVWKNGSEEVAIGRIDQSHVCIIPGDIDEVVKQPGLEGSPVWQP